MADEQTPRPARAAPTTTHGAWGAGEPRLIVSGPDRRFVYPLGTGVTRIGAALECTLVLPGAASLHATVDHDALDEYVLTMLAPGEMNANPETAWVPGHHGRRSEVLRTGARFTVGPWSLVFVREEFADHGRPYGGRQGGEFAHQQRQPDRPDYPEGHRTTE